MEFTIGQILEGKVKSITNFGAFVALPEGKTGMVHISEIAHAYVSDIRQHLAEGQDVKVMVMAIDPAGKINLSIKRTMEAPAHQNQSGPRRNFDRRPQQDNRENRDRRPQQDRPRQERSPKPENFSRSCTPAPSKDQSFEDKLKQFMSESDSKLSSVRQYSEHKTKTRRR